jgi:transposase InsO family protein
MHAALAQQQLMMQLRNQLADASHGNRTELVKSAAAAMQCSVQTIFNRLRAVGYASGRKLRADHGDSALSTEHLVKCAAILHARPRANGKQINTIKDVVSIAKANGLIPEDVSYATVARNLRKHGLDIETMNRPDPHVDLKSEHPNHVWQIDASICVLYYLRGTNGLRAMDAKLFNERKPKALASVMSDRVLRYAVTDHTSGAMFCRYYMTAGEDQATLFEFLMDAMHVREGDVMHGVPRMIVWDLGSANTSHAIKALFAGLGVDTWEHRRGNPRAKGQVEGAHNIIETQFEARLAFMQIASVEALNAELGKWLRKKNGVDVHTRHEHTRWAMWQTIRQEELRLCPARSICEQLMLHKAETRQVQGNLMIEFKVRGFESMHYSVAHIPTVRVGDRVEVAINPYTQPNVFVSASDSEGKMRQWECKPEAINKYGFFVNANTIGQDYKQPTTTSTQANREQLNAIAWGTTDEEAIAKLKRQGVPAFGGGLDAMADVNRTQVPQFLERKGTALNVSAPLVSVERARIDVVDILRALRAALDRPISPEENTHVRANYSAGCDPTELAAIIESLVNPQAAAPKPKLAIVR